MINFENNFVNERERRVDAFSYSQEYTFNYRLFCNDKPVAFYCIFINRIHTRNIYNLREYNFNIQIA